MVTSLPHGAHVEWRSPEDALALDVSLVHDVFRRLARRRHEEATTGPHQPNQQTTSFSFHPDMVFTKSNVLVALERSEGFLQKRPLLRMLHTSLACVSLEKEGASLEGFVRFRVKERTLSFATVRDRLLRIHARTQRAAAFEQQLQEFTRQARATSPWCVRDWKSVHRSPSQLYKVHVIPLKPKTEKQLDAERQALAAVAAAVVNNAVQLCVGRLVDGALAARMRSRTARTSTPQSLGVSGDAAPKKTHGITGDPRLRAKARKAREQADVEARRRELRLQIFVPAFESSAFVSSAATSTEQRSHCVPVSPSASSTDKEPSTVVAGSDGSGDDGDDNHLESRRDTTTGFDTSTRKATRSRRSSLLLLLLATAEANGDARIAEQLVGDKIARSGFQRALEQATNLGLAREDYWGLLKIWITVYRSHSLQSFRAATDHN
ncbi:hypothetical protein PybrP1_000899 [[Pythium] brassicae (nom. inval.)]|nr:hypothetical protein PybrP1_000899 [[Pythium] brassicae (nom. inval.)]